MLVYVGEVVRIGCEVGSNYVKVIINMGFCDIPLVGEMQLNYQSNLIKEEAENIDDLQYVVKQLTELQKIVDPSGKVNNIKSKQLIQSL